jgi:hypothetical protein
VLGDPIVFNPGGAYSPTPGGDVTFTTTRQEPGASTRLNIATDLSLPEYMVVRHSVQGGKADKIVDRHLVQFTRAERDPDTGQIYTIQSNMTLVVPRVALFTVEEVRALVKRYGQLLMTDSDANLAKILRGET